MNDVLDTEERKDLPDSVFGLPQRREFPMPDSSAICEGITPPATDIPAPPGVRIVKVIDRKSKLLTGLGI